MQVSFRRFFFVAVLSLCGAGFAIGQIPDSVVGARLGNWVTQAATHPPDLFLQLDKSVYAPGENILFTGYLLDRGSDTVTPHILYIVLVDLAAGKLINSDRFLMSEGVGSGALFVPDTLESGSYLVVAYTDVMRDGPAGHFFRQPVDIRSKVRPDFSVAVGLSPDSVVREDSIRLTCRVGTDYGGLASGGVLRYRIAGDGRVLQSGSRILDSYGETRFVLPSEDTLLRSILLYTEISRGDHKGHFRTALFLRPGQVVVHYFPESGSLIDGHDSRVGIEVRKKDGRSVATRGILLEDGKEVVRFQTDRYGFGFFDCRWRKGKSYEVHLPDLPPGTYACGRLPEILPEGLSLHVDKSVCRDSLTLDLEGAGVGEQLILLLYSESGLLYSARIGLKNGNGTLTLPVKDWPGGIAHLVVFTADGRAVAGRTVFVPPPAEPSVAIQTDSVLYHPRSRVKMHIKISDGHGKGVRGLFSFGCVLSARLAGSGFPDLVRHSDFGHYLQPGDAAIPPAEYFNDDSAIEKILLARFSKPLSAGGMEGGVEARSAVPADDYGWVRFHNGKSPRRPVSLMVLGSSFHSLETDSSGQFQIPYQALLAPIGSNPILSVNDNKQQADYDIVLQNRHDTVNRQLAGDWYSPTLLTMDTTIREDTETSSPFNSVKVLKAAVVKAGGARDYAGDGSCRDWVCVYDVLNCPNHPTGRKPVKGESYLYIDPSMGPFARPTTVVYRTCISCNGCDRPSFVGTVRGIHLTPDFYKTDSANFNPLEPAVYSTLFWAPMILTDGNGEAEFSFYTNDLTGSFKAIVEGISAAGVFGGKGAIKVGAP